MSNVETMSLTGTMRSRTAIVDLTKLTVSYEDAPPKLVRKYLGGRGMNAAYLHRFLERDVDPLSPGNVLVIGTGALTGTGSPNSNRFNVTAKSPETGFLGDANCGGFFAPLLRHSGVDRIVVLGKATQPVYLKVEDNVLSIENAESLWGLDVHETQTEVHRRLGTAAETICIGPAGENLVRYACVMTGIKNAAARGGLGAVMGSKNLKAVVALGGDGIKLADPAGFLKLSEELKDYLTDSKVVKVLGRVGTPLLYEVSNYLGAIRTRNSQDSQFESTLDAEVIHEHISKMISCHSCVVHCRHRNIHDGEGPEYTTIVLLGANLGIANTANVIRLNNLVNKLGLDVSSTGGVLSWAIELYEKGIIDDSITGEPLRFGDYELVVRLINAISNREGFGNILAESSQAGEALNDPQTQYLTAVKGLPQSDPHDCRFIKGFALGIAVSSRGADHLRSRPTLEVFDLPKAFLKEIYGQDVESEPTSYRTKEIVVSMHEDIYATIDCLGICKFICHGFNSPKLLNYGHFSALLSKAYGLEITEEELRGVGRSTVDVERAFINREGVTGKDDTLPWRYFEEPMPHGVAKGHQIDRKEFAALLQRFYKLHGWTEDGLVTPQRVAELLAPWDEADGGVQ
jgi:aldehyde:ferredoxin oxidoreductase